MIRETNPTSFLLYETVAALPFLLVALRVFRSKAKISYVPARSDWLHGVVIGITYALCFILLFKAKLLSPNAGYPTAIKSTQVVPMTLIGYFWFKEKMTTQGWCGLGAVCVGLVCVTLN